MQLALISVSIDSFRTVSRPSMLPFTDGPTQPPSRNRIGSLQAGSIEVASSRRAAEPIVCFNTPCLQAILLISVVFLSTLGFLTQSMKNTYHNTRRVRLHIDR
jgi:hypothetical protein